MRGRRFEIGGLAMVVGRRDQFGAALSRLCSDGTVHRWDTVNGKTHFSLRSTLTETYLQALSIFCWCSGIVDDETWQTNVPSLHIRSDVRVWGSLSPSVGVLWSS